MSTNIDKEYENLLNATPESAPKILENVDNIEEPVNAMNTISEDEKKEESKPQKVLGSYNPATGNYNVIDTETSIEEIQQKNLENFDAMINDETPDLNADLNKFLDSCNDRIPEADAASKIAYLMANRIAGNNIDYYSSMPKFMQNTVSQIMANANTVGVPSNRILHKNQVAKMLIDEYVEEYKKSSQKTVDLDTLFSGFTKDAANIADDMATQIGDLMLSFDDERKDQINNAIVVAKNNGNDAMVKNLEAIRDNIDKAFNLDEFKEFCKHCKIKTIEMKKPNRVYDSFIHKYETNDVIINDIRTCPDVIIRHLTEFTKDQAMMICLAYCKYCCNMNPDNMAEHTFMYYFIRNIIAIDRINPRGRAYHSINAKDKIFYDTFVANLRECMNNLLERNVTFK